jgi:fumarylpyruvate hydrolase
MELVVAIGAAGFRVSEAEAEHLVWGYACGLDMTRRDLQLVAREAGRPWDLAKNFEHAAVLSEIAQGRARRAAGRCHHAAGQWPDPSERQSGAADLEHPGTHRRPLALLPPAAGRPDLHRHPGGVSAVVPGDRLSGSIEGVGELTLTIGEGE